MAEEPVKLMQRTSGRSKNSSAIGTASPGAWVTTLSTPAGKPASSSTSAANRPAEIGASSDGFSTTVLPKASGLTIVRQASTWAPFQGEMPATTPIGRRRARANVSGMSERMTSPAGR